MLGYIRAHWRKWRVRKDLYANRPERHPALRAIVPGELLPWKGTHWRVADVRELPIPAVILVPAGETRASKIATVTRLRRADRILTKEERVARQVLDRRARD